MSDNKFKVAIRGHIPELDGKKCDDVLVVFKEKLGPPDEEDGLWYDSKKHRLTPVHDYKNKRWGLEHIICCTYICESAPQNVSLTTLMEIQEEMQVLFPSIGEVRVAAYEWYDGVDEPITIMAEKDPGEVFGPVVEGYEDAADDLGGGWSYRVIKFPTHYALHEVFYNKAGEPTAHTENPITFVCDLDEGEEIMIKSLVWALKDIVDRPVLTPEDFPYSKEKK